MSVSKKNIHICIHIYICIYRCIYIYTYAHVDVYMPVYVYMSTISMGCGFRSIGNWGFLSELFRSCATEGWSRTWNLFLFFKGVEPFIKPLDKDTLSKLCEESCEGPQDVCQASSFKNLMTHPGLWNAGRCKHLLRPVLQILSFSSTWRCHVLLEYYSTTA